ncbi:MAG: hypothetical protein ACOYOO_12915 [Saprospiraceae bacterium]
MNRTINRGYSEDLSRQCHSGNKIGHFCLHNGFWRLYSQVVFLRNASVRAGNYPFSRSCHPVATGLLLCVATCLALCSSGQSAAENQYNELTVRALTESGGLAPVATAFDTRYEGVRGSPLLFETWKEGTIKIKGNDQVITPVKLNINLEKQVAAVYYQNGSIGLLPGNRLEYLSFEAPEGQQRFILLPANLVDPARNSDLRFYGLLHEGDRFTLLKYISREFRKADYKGAYSTQVRYDEYVEEIQYFLRLEDGPYVKVRPRASAIAKQLAAWKLALPSNAGKADPDSVAGVIEILRALEQK